VKTRPDSPRFKESCAPSPFKVARTILIACCQVKIACGSVSLLNSLNFLAFRQIGARLSLRCINRHSADRLGRRVEIWPLALYVPVSSRILACDACGRGNASVEKSRSRQNSSARANYRGRALQGGVTP
jgi:hypothetical protein